MLLLIAIPIAIALGFLAGGSFRGLNSFGVRGEGVLAVLLPAALLLQVASASESIILMLLRISVGMVVLVVAYMNRRAHPGMVLIGFGIAANMVLVVAFGHMPVLYETAGGATGGDYFHKFTAVAFPSAIVADIVPVVMAGKVTAMVSLGDMLLAIGTVVTVVSVMCSRPITAMKPSRLGAS